MVNNRYEKWWIEKSTDIEGTLLSTETKLFIFIGTGKKYFEIGCLKNFEHAVPKNNVTNFMSVKGIQIHCFQSHLSNFAWMLP
jgi:hypothetical protein